MALRDWRVYREQALDLAKEGYIPVIGDFSRELEEIFLECILCAKSVGKREARLLINSNGGIVVSCAAMRGAMALSGLKFTGIVVGRAFSSGFLLLQACHKRLGVSGAFVMFHWGTMNFVNTQLTAIVKEKTWPVEEMRRELLEIVKFVSKRTGIKTSTLISYAGDERFFTAEDAVKIGYLDGVLASLPNKVVIPKLDN